MFFLYRPLTGTLIGLAAAFVHAAPTNGTQLAAEQANALLNCPISLAAARENLGSLGYAVSTSDGESFTTRYKLSDRDSEKKLLGSYSLQRERQYIVSASGAAAIRFVPRYRETDFRSEGPQFRGNRDQVKEYALPLTASMADTLKDMQAEICSPGERKAAKEHGEKKSMQLDQYLRDRCKAGDDSACQLLSTK
jgi:hypothetical protein